MEQQASKGALAMLLPRSVVGPRIRDMLIEMKGSGMHAGRQFQKIALALCDEYCVEKFRMRSRLITLGLAQVQFTIHSVT